MDQGTTQRAEGRVRRSAALAASVALTRTKPGDVPRALRQFKPAARKRTRAQSVAKTQADRKAEAASSSQKRAKATASSQEQQRCPGSAPPRNRKRKRQHVAAMDQRHDCSPAEAAAVAAAAAAGASPALPITLDNNTGSSDITASEALDKAAGGVTAGALSGPRAIASPLPDMVTPGLRKAVDASRSKHETRFALEKTVRVSRSPSVTVCHECG